MNKSLPLSIVLTAFAAQACAESPSGYVQYPPSASATSGSAAPASSSTAPTKFEAVPEGESGQIAEIISLTTKLLEDRYGTGLARRGVHPKDHGCLEAKFTVNPDIPEAYRVGVLAKPGQSYDTWIRFSNATGRITPDVAPNGAATSRGMAIKLMGIKEGTTLLGEAGAKTQDFLLINQNRFAFANVADYLEVTKLQLKHHDKNELIFPDLFKLPSPGLAETGKIVTQIARTPLGNPLDTPYFSASPFLFGKDKVAKFAVKPREPGNTPVPTNPSPNYLREALKKSLDEKDGKPAVFDFQVQIRSSDAQSIENASADWEDKPPSAFQNVATITIDRQDFDNPLRITECEHLVFTPWHGLVEFQPIGGINRLRLGVYNASAKYRAHPQEPSGFPLKP